MNLWKKEIAMVMLVAMVLMMAPQSVDACTKKSDCTGTGTSVTCYSIRDVSGGSHQIGEPNGNVITCYITVRYGTHMVYCSSCGSHLSTENRTCSMTHSNLKYCTNRYGLCR